MIIARFEGDRHSFEVVLMSDGFIVRARSIATGEPVADRDRLFRTPQGAFSFAENAARDDEDSLAPGIAGLTLDSSFTLLTWSAVAAVPADAGVSAGLMAAWARHAEMANALVVN